MKTGYIMSNTELQISIIITNQMIIQCIKPSNEYETFKGHLNYLLKVQKIRAGYVTLEQEEMK